MIEPQEADMRRETTTTTGLARTHRHTRHAARAMRFVARHRTGAMNSMLTKERASQLLARFDNAAADPAVQHEAWLAASALTRALQRSRRLGLARALDDRQVIEQLQRTARHATNLVDAAERPIRRSSHHRPARATIGIASVLVAGGIAYAGWRASLQSTA
jgi:hypothetical protein